MKVVTVILNLTDREVETIRRVGFTEEEYVQSIVHYDLEKMEEVDWTSTIPEERTPDHNLM